MGLFGFSSKKKNTARCVRCNTPLKEDDVRRYEGEVYCDFCLGRVREEDTRRRKQDKPRIVDAPNTNGGVHPAIAEIERKFKASDFHCHTVHVQDQSELIAGISGKHNSYEIKFICKDGSDNDIALRVFNLIAISGDKTDAILQVLNEVQREYRYLRFTLDSDNEVRIEYDLPNCTENIGKIGVELLVRTMKIVDDIYPRLMQSIWK